MTQLRRRYTGMHTLQVETRPEPSKPWKPLPHLVALGYESPFTPAWELSQVVRAGGQPGQPVLPFQPLTVRCIDGDEGGRVLNPVTLLPSGASLAVPDRSRGLAIIPRLGALVARELWGATPETALAAISTLVLVCEFTAPDAAEALDDPPSSLAAIAVPARGLLDGTAGLLAAVSVNGSVVGQANATGLAATLGSLLAEASEAERLLPGELFTFDVFAAAGTGVTLGAGDRLVIAAPRLGRIEHTIG